VTGDGRKAREFLFVRIDRRAPAQGIRGVRDLGTVARDCCEVWALWGPMLGWLALGTGEVLEDPVDHLRV
jgi:hypothetical protein